MYVEQIEEF